MSKARPVKRSRWGLFVPFLIAGVLIAAWSIYYAIMHNVLSTGIDDWIADERARGNIVEFERKSLSGYPFRFELRVDQPVYGEPGGAVWRGQQLQMVMQPWNWNHVIARSPGRNEILPPGGLEGDELRILLGPRSVASLSWSGETGLVRRGSIALDEVDVSLAGVPLGRADGFEFHLRPPPSDADMLQVQVNFEAIEIDELPEDVAVLGNMIGPGILRMEIDQGAALMQEGVGLDRVPAEALARGGQVRLPQVMLEWGPANLGARGELLRTNDRLGGTLGLRIEEADALRDALREAGQLTEDVATAIDGLELASANGGFLIANVRDDGLYVFGEKIADVPLGLWLMPGTS